MQSVERTHLVLFGCVILENVQNKLFTERRLILQMKVDSHVYLVFC